MALSAIDALQKYGYNTGDKSKHVSVVGIDGLQEAKDLVDKGIMTRSVTQSPDIIAEALYTISLNLISNVNPVQNTDCKVVNESIVIPEYYQQYIKK
jgi:methyl-galactoside transport system substrate-binding protein